MSALQVVPADQVPEAALHAAFTQAFSDYLIGAFDLPLAQWPRFLARQAAVLALSRVAMAGPDILAFAFAAPRPLHAGWRLATMGAVPAARGTGAAAQLLDDFVARAADAGQAWVELECFAQNERAVRLYRRHGFETVHALYGYAGRADALAAEDCASVSLEEAFAWLDAFSATDDALPLQVTPVCLRGLPGQLLAWRCGAAQAVVAPSDDKLVVHCLVHASRAQGDAERLLRHLQALFADATLHAPQLQREDIGGAALVAVGLERLPLHQWLMRRPLRPA